MPMTSRMSPPMMSGKAHGVLESTGQVTATRDGAAFCPSDATITLTSSGMFMRVTCAASPSNSSSQRSDPAGLGPTAAVVVPPAAADGVGAGVGFAVAAVAASPPSVAVAVGFGVTALAARVPVAFW